MTSIQASQRAERAARRAAAREATPPPPRPAVSDWQDFSSPEVEPNSTDVAMEAVDAGRLVVQHSPILPPLPPPPATEREQHLER